MTIPALCRDCPALARLEAAKAHFRAQRDDIARLSTLLDRYQRLGLRRLRWTGNDTLTGTGLWWETFHQEHALAQAHATIQRQARLLAVLKSLLTPGEALRASIEEGQS